MPLPHDEATANIMLDGLAICCFSRGDQRWDLAYLRHNHHNHELVLSIDGHPDSPVVFRPNDGRSITITTREGISPYGQFPNGYFGRDSIRDRRIRPANFDEAENFRWIVDLENPADIDHGRGRLKNPGFLVTRTFIQHAVFYTQSLPVKRLHRLLDTEDGITMSETEFNRRLYGRVNDLIGADINVAPSRGAIDIVIDFGRGRTKSIGPLPHRPGNPWQISLTNMRFEVRDQHKGSETEKDHDADHDVDMTALTHGRRKGDFQLYYAAFELQDQRKRRALWGFPDPVALTSGRTDCNMVFAGTSPNLDEVFR